MARELFGEGDEEINLPADVDIDQLLLELAGMDAGQRSDGRGNERVVEREGWEGEGRGGRFGDDSGVAAFENPGAEEKKWRKKKKKRRRGWDPEVREQFRNSRAFAILLLGGGCFLLCRCCTRDGYRGTHMREIVVSFSRVLARVVRSFPPRYMFSERLHAYIKGGGGVGRERPGLSVY